VGHKKSRFNATDGGHKSAEHEQKNGRGMIMGTCSELYWLGRQKKTKKDIAEEKRINEFRKKWKLAKKWRIAIENAVEKMLKEPEKNWMFDKTMFNGCRIVIYHENGKNYIVTYDEYGGKETFEVTENIDFYAIYTNLIIRP